MKLELEINVDETTIDKRQLEARELGLRRLEFMELLRQRGIPYVIYTAEDLDQDLATLDRLAPQIDGNLRPKTSAPWASSRFHRLSTTRLWIASARRPGAS